MYTYILIHLFTILFPLLYSFDSKISYYKNWKPLFISISIVAIFFVVWDHIFTQWNVWSFNPEYLLGYYLFGLPIEEILFFITVPFSCVFIYEALNYFFKNDIFEKYAQRITLLLTISLMVVGILTFGRLYTSTTFIFTAIALAVHLALFRNKILPKFLLAYLFHLIPFFIINGILTALPVVSYNDSENLGMRIGTIPVEDMVYSMLLLLLNISIYEFLKIRRREANIKDKKFVAKVC